MIKKSKIVAVFIALNAQKTLEKFYQEFPKDLVDEIILFDDHSDDLTFKLAKKLGIKAKRNNHRLGYGGNIKLALRTAIRNGADIIIDLHPDGEYKPSAISAALKKVEEGTNLVLGNRFTKKTWPTKSGMRVWKVIPILMLNLIDRVVLKIDIHDFHQGFRVYTKPLLESINFENNSNGYLFSFELIAQAIFYNFKIAEVPVVTHYTGKKRGASLKSSINYTWGTFLVLFEYYLARLGFKSSLFRKKIQSPNPEDIEKDN